MSAAIEKINSFIYQTGFDFRLSGSSYISYPGGYVPVNPISNFKEILDIFLSSNYDLLITSNFDESILNKNLNRNDKLIVKYIDIGRYFEQFNISKDSFGKLPDFIGNYEYVNENNAGFSVKFWDDRWFNLISERIDEIISQGYDGIFLDDISKANDWLPNNKLGNPVIADAKIRMGLLIEKIRNYIDLKSPDKHLILVLNEPLSIIENYPSVVKYFDLALQEGGLSTITNASLINNLKHYDKYEVPVLGFDWFPGVPDISILINNLKLYVQYSKYSFSYNVGFQGPEILRSGPFIQTANDYDNSIFGKLTGINLLSTGAAIASTLNGGLDAKNYFIGAGKNSIAIGGHLDDYFNMHLLSQYEIGYINIVCSNSTTGVLAAPKLSVKINGNLIINSEVINSIYGKNSNFINLKIPTGLFDKLELIVEGSNSIDKDYSCIQVEEIRINGFSIDLSNFTYTNGGLNSVGVPYSYNGSIEIPKSSISTALSRNLDFGQVTCIGGAGIDTLDYSGISSVEVAWGLGSNGKWLIKSSKFIINDIVSEIERLYFANTNVALDLNGNAGTTAKILGAVFGKESVANKNYVGIGLHFLDSGWTYDNLAGVALDAAGAKTNDQIVSLLWTNVIRTVPTAADKQPFIALLENGMTAGALAQLAADTSFNTININLVGLAQTGIEYIPVG